MARVNVPVTDTGFVAAAYTTALTGTQNDLVFTAVDPGPGGNDITIEYVVSGTNTALAVSVANKAITVTVATNGGGTATSTATEVKNKIDANGDANKLVSVALAASNDGTGVVTSLAVTNLASGSLGVSQPSQTNSDSTNDMYLTGNDGMVMLEVYNAHASTQTVLFWLAPSVAAGQSLTSATQTLSIPTVSTRIAGPFPPALFNQNQAGDIHFDPSVSTDLKFRAYRVERAR